MTHLDPAVRTAPLPGPTPVEAFAAESALTPLDHAMDRYADGDDSAFTVIFAGLAPRVLAFLRRLSGSPDLAEDLTQETFLKLHQARGSFVRGRSVVPWTYAIARNCYMSHARSPKARLSRASVEVTKGDVKAELGASAEEAAMARQSAKVVERALAEMTPARREAFILLRYEGLSVAAAAQISGVTEGALKLRAFHAYETIRSALKAMEDTTGPSIS
jgi:RNA polymerase sigma-70 factor (ECF subfamily)